MENDYASQISEALCRCCAETIQLYGTDAQKSKYLPLIEQGATCSMDLSEPQSGSDLQSVRTTATYDEERSQWFLNGSKRFITNGAADIHLVLARSEEGSVDARGLSLFIYHNLPQPSTLTPQPFTLLRKHDKIGLSDIPVYDLRFTNAPAELIGDRRFGLIKYARTLMNSARLAVASQSITISEEALSQAQKYARHRRQFGKTIAEIPAVAEMLLNIEARLEGMRTLLDEALRQQDGRRADYYTALAKGMCSEMVNINVYEALQVHGGVGCMKGTIIERLYRDARILSIYEGTTQMQVSAAQRYLPQSGSAPITDANARHHYEIAAWTLMQQLLSDKAASNPSEYAAISKHFALLAESEIAKHSILLIHD